MNCPSSDCPSVDAVCIPPPDEAERQRVWTAWCADWGGASPSTTPPVDVVPILDRAIAEHGPAAILAVLEWLKASDDAGAEFFRSRQALHDLAIVLHPNRIAGRVAIAAAWKARISG